MANTYYEFRRQKFVEKLQSRFLEVINNADNILDMEIEAKFSRGEAPSIRYDITELITPDAESEEGDGE